MVVSVQSLSHIVQVLDPEGNGSINFVQFSEGVKRIVELQGYHFYLLTAVTFVFLFYILYSYIYRFYISDQRYMNVCI